MNSKIIIENNIVKSEKLPLLSNDKCLNEILLENLKSNPDFIGIIDSQTGEKCSYRKLANESIRLALWLKKQEINPGDIVSICSDHRIAIWSPFCATLFIGANLNIWYDHWSPVTLRYFAKLTKPKIIFASEQKGSVLKKIFQEENIDTKVIILSKISDFNSVDDILECENSGTVEIDDFKCHPVKDDDDVLLLFSSGSTGMPKGVQHSHRSTFYNLSKFCNMCLQKKELNSAITTPLYWIGTTMQILRCLLLVYPVIIIAEPTPEKFCQSVNKYKIQWTVLGTAFLNELFSSGLLDKYDFSCVEEILGGGAKVRAEILKKFESILPNGVILQGYGLTEFGGVALIREKSDKNYERMKLIYDMELKIIDTNVKNILGPNEEGEICLKHSHIMKHYFQNPEASQEIIDQNGWLHTGDLGYYDYEGNVYIIDRIKELIKYQGHHISPNEIEKILAQHPEVLEVAVVGIPHPVDVEHTLAFIAAKTSTEVLKKELFKMSLVLGEKKRLHKIVFVENLPKAGKKISRSEVKIMAKAYVD